MKQQDDNPARLILVVDDDPLIRKSMLRVLGSEFEVLLASGKKEADTILQSRDDIRLVISDCQMEEGRSGVALLKQLRDTRPEIIRVLVSGSLGAREAQSMVDDETAHVYLAKPWSKDRLVETVRVLFYGEFRDS